MRNLSLLLVVWLAAVIIGCGDGPTPTSPTIVLPGAGSSGTTSGSGAAAGGPGTASTIGYTEDIKPILDADCIRCHNSRTHESNVDLSTYAAVLRTLQAGNSNSVLIRVTRSNGSMYREWRGSAAEKAELVRSWIVNFQARESR